MQCADPLGNGPVEAPDLADHGRVHPLTLVRGYRDCPRLTSRGSPADPHVRAAATVTEWTHMSSERCGPARRGPQPRRFRWCARPGPSPWWRVSWSQAAALRAVRATIVVPCLFALTFKVIGDAQMTLFAVFGSFAQLVTVTFGGTRRDKAVAHLVLAAAGALAVTIGTLASGSAWLAALVDDSRRVRDLLRRLGRAQRRRGRDAVPVRVRPPDRLHRDGDRAAVAHRRLAARFGRQHARGAAAVAAPVRRPAPGAGGQARGRAR